ncbi:MAG: NADPH-dependent F420 reductase [Candidatus Methylomirabilales bacterium]
MRIAVIGGTGKEGQGLALGWARAGEEVIIGSRSRERAELAAEAINAAVARLAANAALNREAAARGDVVVLTVPYAAHAETLKDIREAVRGKIVVDVTVPVDPEHPRRLRDVAGGSATEEAQALLGPDARVVAAFQNISHTHLSSDRPPDADVLVCGDDAGAREAAIRLAGLLGLRGVDCGPARNARVIEGLTILLLAVNRRYKVKGAGVRITGI